MKRIEQDAGNAGSGPAHPELKPARVKFLNKLTHKIADFQQFVTSKIGFIRNVSLVQAFHLDTVSSRFNDRYNALKS